MWAAQLTAVCDSAVASSADNDATLPTGDRFDLPASALEALVDAPSPLVFSLTHNTRKVYGTVRQFTAPDTTILLSPWLQHALDLPSNGGQVATVSVRQCTLEKGTHAVFQPLSSLSAIHDVRHALFRSYVLMVGHCWRVI